VTEPGIDRDGAGIDMYPSATARIMADLAKAAADVKSGWEAHIGVIAGLDGQLGHGPLGRPMVKQYNDGVRQIREGVDQVQGQVDHLSTTGTQAVADYRAADAASAQNFTL
jgi:hypothetical protein